MNELSFYEGYLEGKRRQDEVARKAKAGVKPHKPGDLVTVDGKPGEISHVHTATGPDDSHSYRITDLSANDPYKQHRLERGNYIPHHRVKLVKSV
jgi:hypothetical protein